MHFLINPSCLDSGEGSRRLQVHGLPRPPQFLAARLGPPLGKHVLGSTRGPYQMIPPQNTITWLDLITLILTAPNQWTQGLRNNVPSKPYHPESRFPMTFGTIHWELVSWEDKGQNIKSNIVQVQILSRISHVMKFYNHECPDAKEKHSVMCDSMCAVDSQKTHTTYIYIQRDLRLSGIVYIRSSPLTLSGLPFFWAVPLRVQNGSKFDNQVVYQNVQPRHLQLCKSFLSCYLTHIRNVLMAVS